MRGGVAANPSRRMAAPVDFILRRGGHTALVGPNGSGKSTVVQMITGGLYLREGSVEYAFLRPGARIYEAVRTVAFSDAYGTVESPYYHQQRWHSAERDTSPVVGALMAATPAASDRWREELYDLLELRGLFGRELVTLSSGELRRCHIGRALLSAPEVLVLESPFIGLDPPTRELLCRVLERVAGALGVSFVMTLTSADELPPMITHVYMTDSMRCSRRMTRAEALAAASAPAHDRAEDPVLPAPTHVTPVFGSVVDMRGVTVAYGDRRIFERLDWHVASGEAWNITGRNGCGKSTLLSLVCADNPRAYSLDMTLFDRRRGTGESIWDIKSHIGYLSPEMHRACTDDIPAEEVAASGLFDAFGVRRRMSDRQRAYCMEWMECFGAAHLAGRSFVRLSSGEQRLVLLARAFVKDPDLLILDEPFQGLDPAVRARAKRVIESFCRRSGKTLLFVTHYPDELPAVIGRTLRLGCGTD